MEYIIGALVAWFAISFIEEYTTICGVLEFPMKMLYAIFLVVSYPFIIFYCIFLRHTIKPVKSEAVQKAKIMDTSKRVFGSIYICFDKKAKRFANKVFFFRMIEGELEKPSSPDLAEMWGK